MNLKIITENFRNKSKSLAKVKSSSWYRKAIGKLVQARILKHSSIKPYKGRVSLQMVLDAGEIEPRVLEVLPAVLLKKPNLLAVPKELPSDVKSLLLAIRKGKAAESFRGIAPKYYLPWVDRIGHKNKKTNLIRSFRFCLEDILLLEKLKDLYRVPYVQVIRMGLSNLEKSKS